MQFLFSGLSNESTPRVHRPKGTQLPDIWTTIAIAGVNLNLEPTPKLQGAFPIPASGEHHVDLPKQRCLKRTLFTSAQRQILSNWLYMHRANPYPTTTEKDFLMRETGLHREQINVWFTNNRIRQGFTAAPRPAAQFSSGFNPAIRP
jgi:hypothetical protein